MIVIKSAKGFTIVELMVATSVFSAILLISLAGLIQIGRMYQKGVTSSQTQETSRGVMDEITQAIQFNGGNVKSPYVINPVADTLPVGPIIAVPAADVSKNAVGYFCIGTTRYTYSIDRKQSPTNSNVVASKEIKHAMWVDEPTICADAAQPTDVLPNIVDLTADLPTPKGRDMLSDNMRIVKLNIIQPALTVGVWQVQLTIAYGDSDLLVLNGAGDSLLCKGTSVGAQFCSVSELSTIVKRRVL
ncbi:MAG: prepilin-type N-terminal cleavage/methylation domain-containing protein [bacterium]